jgi:quercetin dioxygenase-like cupin family protein
MKPQRKLKVVEIEPAVFNATDSIEYQKGTVVSRQLLKGEKGNVTLFAFSEGEGLSEHTAPFDALVHVLQGEAEITISRKNFTLRDGDMIVMPANRPHAVRAVQDFKMLLTMIRS